MGGEVSVEAPEVRPLEAYGAADAFDLVVLATKAHDAIAAAPRAAESLSPGGVLLPIQNGGVSQMLGETLGTERVLGGLSNLGATMIEPGVYEQRNAGHLLIGELDGGPSERIERVRRWLGRAVQVRATANLRGAVWSKLLLNCSVTTIGAIAGCTMREYIALPEGRALFERTFDEALRVALASGARPERMIVDPAPASWGGRSVPGPEQDAWIAQVLEGYGDVKPSMLQDFERGRRSEVDFINGYVVKLGTQLGVATPANAAIVATVHAIERDEARPHVRLLTLVGGASR
jgi:2-dehydropantoate 2-reductase